MLCEADESDQAPKTRHRLRQQRWFLVRRRRASHSKAEGRLTPITSRRTHSGRGADASTGRRQGPLNNRWPLMELARSWRIKVCPPRCKARPARTPQGCSSAARPTPRVRPRPLDGRPDGAGLAGQRDDDTPRAPPGPQARPRVSCKQRRLT